MKIPFLANLKQKSRFSLRAPLDRTFIFPNTFGLLFGGIAFVLLLMSMGYANNLLYFYVFFLISIAVTGMWVTNKNVDRISIKQIKSDYLFATEPGQLLIGIDQNQNTKRNRFSQFLFPSKESFNLQIKTIADQTWIEGSPKIIDQIDNGLVTLDCIAPRRGPMKSPRIEIESTFPFSMLRAWKYGQSENEFLVYPERKGSKSLPSILSASDDERRLLDAESQDDQTGLFSHHREFQNNDPVYRIDWKRSAKFDKLFVKKFEESRSHKQAITWGMTSHLGDPEARLSQMSLWTDLCEKSGFEYRLILPNGNTGFDRGEGHFKKCMSMLALYNFEGMN